MGCTILLTFLFILTACNPKDEEKNQNDQEVSQATSIGSEKPIVQGVDNVDVLNKLGSIDGLERLQNFYNNLQNGISSDLRIVHFTFEGNPIVVDLKYDGDSMKVIHDSSLNNYGSGEITTSTCNGLVEEINPSNTTYIAVGCSDGLAGMLEILALDYNVNQHDLFESELKHDENPEIGIQGYILQVNNDSLLIGVDLNRMQSIWIIDQLQQIDFSAYSFDFIRLEGVTNGEFKIGDKITAVIEGTVTGSNPGKAQVKDIKKLDIAEMR